MKYAKPFALSLCLFLAIVLSACGDDGGSGPSGSDEPLSSSSEGGSGDGSSIGGSSDDDDGYSSDENGSGGGRSSKKKSSSSSSSTSSSSADEGPQSPLGACGASNAGEIKQDVDALVGEAGVRALLARMDFSRELVALFRRLSPRLFGKETDRQKLVDAAQEHLDGLVSLEEEAERQKQEEASA